MAVMNNPHDRFFKAVFSRSDVAGDFLRQCLTETLFNRLDLSTLTLRRESFIDPNLQQQFADLLYAVRFADHTPALVYVLFEHKSYPQAKMAFHMLRYMVRIWEQSHRETPDASLTPIIPIVVYHGAEPWREPVAMDGLFFGPEEMRPFWPTFIYQLSDLALMDIHTGSRVIYLRTAALILRTILRPDFLVHLSEIVSLLAQLTTEYGALEYVITVFRYVTAVHPEITADTMHRVLREAAIEAKEELMSTWIDEAFEQGVVSGEQTGRTDEARRFVVRQLQHRFGSIDSGLLRRIQRLSLSQLEAMSTVVLDATSITDIADYLDASMMG